MHMQLQMYYYNTYGITYCYTINHCYILLYSRSVSATLFVVYFGQAFQLLRSLQCYNKHTENGLYNRDKRSNVIIKISVCLSTQASLNSTQLNENSLAYH